MRVAVFSAKPYDEQYLSQANRAFGHELVFFEPHLSMKTAQLAAGFPAVCVFVNDVLDQPLLSKLHDSGIRLIALRCAGFNNVDLCVAEKLGITVVRVPAYSPYAVAEYTIGLILTLNRKIHRAYNRVREGNFSLEGLEGFDLQGKTAGIVGSGRIGTLVAETLKCFGCRVLAYDPCPSILYEEKGIHYVELNELFQQSDIISLHCPLSTQTYHLVDEKAITRMKPGVMLINTSRGAIIDAQAVTRGLKSGKIGYLGLDVYEEEADLFFEDLSGKVIQDDIFARLLTFPNVLITGHQAFFTRDALQSIAGTTLANISDIEQDQSCMNEVKSDWHYQAPCKARV